MLLSTDLAMLPAGHQMMERLRVRLLCNIIILAILAILPVSSEHGGCTGNSAIITTCNAHFLCKGHAKQGTHHMLATLPSLDGQGAAACLHDANCTYKLHLQNQPWTCQCRQSNTASPLHLPSLRRCPVSAGAAAMLWAAPHLMPAARAR